MDFWQAEHPLPLPLPSPAATPILTNPVTPGPCTHQLILKVVAITTVFHLSPIPFSHPPPTSLQINHPAFPHQVPTTHLSFHDQRTGRQCLASLAWPPLYWPRPPDRSLAIAGKKAFSPLCCLYSAKPSLDKGLPLTEPLPFCHFQTPCQCRFINCRCWYFANILAQKAEKWMFRSAQWFLQSKVEPRGATNNGGSDRTRKQTVSSHLW